MCQVDLQLPDATDIGLDFMDVAVKITTSYCGVPV